MSTTIRQLSMTMLLGAMAVLGVAAIALGQSGEEVTISETLEPTQLDVVSGTSVTWRNTDDVRHRVRSREGPVPFDSGNLEPGETFTLTFFVEGTYPYSDDRNDEDPAYFGTIVVSRPDDSSGLPPMSASVTIIDESFQPPLIAVAAGATVEWTHVDGDDRHTVTSSDGAFDSGIMEGGATFSQTFESPGIYPYFCAIHPDMLGTITVGGPGGESLEEVPVEEAPVEETPVEGTPAVEPSTSTAVSIVDFAFEPPSIEVEAGTTVTWSNDDIVGHTVTATEGGFDSGTMGVGAEFSQAFEEPGTYAYFCAIHPSMQGTVEVTEPASG